MNAPNKITFENSHRDFTLTLNKRVNSFFKANQLSRYANGEMVIKSVVMMALYFGPYALIISGLVSGTFFTLVLVSIMGFGLAGIGLSVMHDGNHGAYSSRRWVNTMIGYSLNLIGANAFNWKVQHNVLHHSYTNVYDADEDISKKGILRFSPHAQWKWHHRFQFIYAWFLYGLMTIFWMFFKDFEQLIRYQKYGWIKHQKSNAWKEWGVLIITKMVYISYIFVVPLLLTPWLWWQVLIGILIMHYITGFLLAIIFQPAHVIEGSAFPEPDINYSLKYNWTIHQLRTTTNFANKSRWFTWFVGGLNFQVEHHLFPGICHVHYRKLAPIVKKTALQFGFPYLSKRTFGGALWNHAKMLYWLGRKTSSSLE